MGPTLAPISSSLAGLQLAQARLGGDAARIASDPANLDAIVDVGVQRNAFDANLVTLRAEDEDEGRLVDLLA
jgi:predicted nucleotidyltransferase